MKKFYKIAEVGAAPDGYVVRLDGKPLKTPLRNTLLLASKALAEAIALEWANQVGEINPHAMILTQIANTMVDKASSHEREEMNKQLLDYASSDLVCYFATNPDTLVKKHHQHWMPLIGWLKEEYGVELEVISGIKYKHQSEEGLKKIKALIDALGDIDFTVVQCATGITGSVVISLAVLRGKLSAEQAYEAACVDEIYQLETWGEDEEARHKLNKIKQELTEVERFIGLSKI